jgi:hypothetical protein
MFSVWAMVGVSLLCAAALLVVSLLPMARRVQVQRSHDPASDIDLESPRGEVKAPEAG